jgi:N4-gp56 family major capsid protein
MVVATTTMTQMINPEVMAAMISAELPNKLRFAPLASVDSTLVGRAGNTLTVPTWSYIGDAADIAEGNAIPLDQMATSDDTVTVKKAGKGVEITDEALLSGYGDPAGEAEAQMLKAIASKIDTDLLTAALTTTQTVASIEVGTKLDIAAVRAAVDIFDDEDDSEMILICSASDASALRADALAANSFLAGSELGANALIKGVFGEVEGCQIVKSNKVTDGAPVIIKPGALKLVLKRNVAVETDRDIVKKTTVITADEHYAAYLYDASKVVKITTALA